MTDLKTQLDAILHGAAFAEITDRSFLRITGPDATRWLNGMVTNNIKDLAPGEGNYNFLLNAQGRIQGDCTIYREPGEGDPTFLLEADSSQLTALTQLLDHFIIMDDVELKPLEDLSGILVAGPQAPSIVMELGTANHQAAPCSSNPQPAPQTISLKQTVYAGASVSLILTNSPLVPCFEIWSDPSTIASILTELSGTSALPISAAALEAYRILSATPRYGTDIRNTETAKDLPQETAQTHALHFNKGCYLGQEIVERIHSRGAVHRTFAQFTLSGPVPTLPAPLELNGKTVGELTSAAVIPLSDGDTTLALGYARLEALNQPLTYPGGTALTRNSKLATQN
ncbi:folate-binding protein [Granulicella sp. 5B5]|uniref:CAF17-like 4Fe-4S cluster assembly/insertion protein YgfZ n=1 Tax=Granulicella sp. 5B5 TaxID=1617967 RepID=UPI0015F35BFC|nr:folate-binding protein YgfZ [Granulicella sp. 5B5]QMV17686.1 folate-binding protein [Granulicella sp. 5B5]